MNTQETQQLIRFLNGIVQTAPPTIDSQAQALIDQAFAKQPHAAYLLTQRCLALSIAVEAAQRRITQLEGNANGLAGANQWGQQPALNQWGQQPALQKPQPAQFAGQTQPQSSWSQGLMGSLLGAAAGVMIGQTLWQGMQHMLSQPADVAGEGAAAGNTWLDSGSTQQAQSDWGTGLSPDDGSFDEGGGDDWI
ncbi:MAG: DUF2076 domain-containing protein [Betaproteobacteria bacterium]|nr:DUF2076 domain-containing protein [Betaproteobacteria bacterium]